MNMLVVLFSVLAVAAAKPSGLLSPYANAHALIAAPAAVSHSSRVDVIQPQTQVLAGPVVAAAPALAYSAPAVLAAAPSAVSHQSRVDVIQPAARVLAAPALAYSAPAVVGAPWASAALAHGPATVIGAPWASAALAHGPATVIGAPWASAALAHGPATVIGAHGVPLDTPEVVAARAAHLQAKALAGHYIHKRSIAGPSHASSSLIAAYDYVNQQSRVDYPGAITTYAAAPLAIAAPLTLSAPLAHSLPLAHSAPLALASPLAHAW